MTTYGVSRLPWPAGTPQHRWYGLGRYYAMFPAPFVTRAINTFTECGDVVMDPFSGRGNAPYIAAALGRPSVAVDILPVAWLFTTAKLNPSQSVDCVLARLEDLRRAVRPQDAKCQTSFESMAWAPPVIGLLRAARRELNWKESRVDRTLTAFIALHMQDSDPKGLSNRLSPTVAHSPSYAVQWWTKRKLLYPPKTNPVAYLTDRIRRRYAFGVPELADSETWLGDARTKLREADGCSVKLFLTSPPYHDMTDYWNDQWIRMWLLGADMHKNWKRAQKHSNLAAYRKLVNGVFAGAKHHVRTDGAVVVRCGDKPTTADACRAAIKSTWPSWTLCERRTQVRRHGKASGYGHGARLVCERDYVAASVEMEEQARMWATAA